MCDSQPLPLCSLQQQTEVPPSPSSPTKHPKSLTNSSSRTGGISLNKMTTPTSTKSNSLGGSSRSRNNSTSSASVAASPSGAAAGSLSGRSNQRGSSKPTQLQHSHGYAVVAGGSHQQVGVVCRGRGMCEMLTMVWEHYAGFSAQKFC